VRVRAAVRGGELPTAHDISDGGLATALAECCIAGGIGARVSTEAGERALFGEGPGGVVVAGPREAVESLEARPSSARWAATTSRSTACSACR
jgi:phosphoribosylformylglycinamidine synthase